MTEQELLSLSSVNSECKLKTSTELKLLSYSVFEESGAYINGKRIFFSYFGEIPNEKRIHGRDFKKLINWIDTHTNLDILKKHKREDFFQKRRKLEEENIVYVLANKIVLDICPCPCGLAWIIYSPDSEAAADIFLKQFIQFPDRSKPKWTVDINLVVSGMRGLDLVSITNKKINLSVNASYNDDLIPVHNTILKSLNTKDKSGLYLFHGNPGTGKSTYIRYLINRLKKKVIFLTAQAAGSMDSPSFMNIIVSNPNAVFIIEDAEELIASRERGNHSAISALLNLTDGILGEGLGIQFICTFNTHIGNIDKALMRKGRLIAMYDFKPLAADKASMLLNSLGVLDYNPVEPMTLADIYNFKEESYEDNGKNRIPLGFGAR